MDNETYEQYTLENSLISESEKYLTEGLSYSITYHEESPVGLELPKTMELKVITAPPEIKKATASASLRPVELENGITIQAPGFIKEGDIVRVNTETNDYMERV
jgi:elongation factor P